MILVTMILIFRENKKGILVYIVGICMVGFSYMHLQIKCLFIDKYFISYLDYIFMENIIQRKNLLLFIALAIMIVIFFINQVHILGYIPAIGIITYF